MITIYTRTTCGYCTMVKKLYDSKKIEYTTVNLDEYPDVAQTLIEKTKAMTVPITTNGVDFVVGWDVRRLLELAK